MKRNSCRAKTKNTCDPILTFHQSRGRVNSLSSSCLLDPAEDGLQTVQPRIVLVERFRVAAVVEGHLRAMQHLNAVECARSS